MLFYIANVSVDFAVLTILVTLCNYTMTTTISPPPAISTITTVTSTGTQAMIAPLALLAVCLTLGT